MCLQVKVNMFHSHTLLWFSQILNYFNIKIIQTLTSHLDFEFQFVKLTVAAIINLSNGLKKNII